MNIRTILATAGLATALAVGAGTAAFAADGTTPNAPSADKVAAHCAKVPSVLERIDAGKAKAQERLTKLTEAKATAEADGKTKRAERLGQVIARVQTRIDKLGSAETRVTDWSSAHCAAA